MPSKVIFLDRDGTLNVDHGYVHTQEMGEWIPGAIDACKKLQDTGYVLAVITNQSGIAHGLYTLEDMHALHKFMEQELEEHGVHLAFIAFCPHSRSQGECDCRKPGIGMAKQIEAKVGEIDYAASWTIGDKEADLIFGKTAGTKTALIRSQYWQEGNLSAKPDLIVDSLQEAAKIIVG